MSYSLSLFLSLSHALLVQVDKNRYSSIIVVWNIVVSSQFLVYGLCSCLILFWQVNSATLIYINEFPSI
jgi:predicted membrane protein